MNALRLPGPAMASIASCFELAGHQVTDALANEFWEHLGFHHLKVNGFLINILRDTCVRKGKKCRRWNVYFWYLGRTHNRRLEAVDFWATKQGLIDMVHKIREFREQALRGICDCETEPYRKRLRMSTGTCSECFLKASLGM